MTPTTGSWALTSQPGNGQQSSRSGADSKLIEKAIYEVKRVIVGQDQLVERILVGLSPAAHHVWRVFPGVEDAGRRDFRDGRRRFLLACSSPRPVPTDPSAPASTGRP